MRHQRHHAHRLVAAASAFLLTMTALVLGASQAYGRIPPDQVDRVGTPPDPTGATTIVGSPLWTYFLVGGVALVLGVALALVAPRLRLPFRTA